MVIEDEMTITKIVNYIEFVPAVLERSNNSRVVWEEGLFFFTKVLCSGRCQRVLFFQ
jgi:hypothetical protein